MSDAALEHNGAEQAKPLVAQASNGRSRWLFGAIALIAALLLFSTLEARRSARTDSALRPNGDQAGIMIAAPPPLAIPDLEGATSLQEPMWVQPIPAGAPSMTLRPVSPVAASPRNIVRPTTGSPSFEPYNRPPAPLFDGPPAGPATVYQASSAQLATPPPEARTADGQRVKASRLMNPSFTVPQGAVIQAVLETALDSTQPGPARAIVSRDVRSFDGSRILVPRGSRLYGNYRADLSQGQNRAMIQWTRLVRPDGVIIALDSPSADPLGRAGVKGKVDTHFFMRIGNALVQTIIGVGANAATRGLNGGTVIVGLPGSTQSVSGSGADQVRPTLRVSQGTPVTVFVARDLDFSEVER